MNEILSKQIQAVSYLKKPLMQDAKEYLDIQETPLLLTKNINQDRYTIITFKSETKEVSYGVLFKKETYHTFARDFKSNNGEDGETINYYDYMNYFKNVRMIIFFYSSNLGIEVKYIMPKVLDGLIKTNNAFIKENKADYNKKQIVFSVDYTYDLVIKEKSLSKIEVPKKIFYKNDFDKQRILKLIFSKLTIEEKELIYRRKDFQRIKNFCFINKLKRKEFKDLTNMISISYFERNKLTKNKYDLFV